MYRGDDEKEIVSKCQNCKARLRCEEAISNNETIRCVWFEHFVKNNKIVNAINSIGCTSFLADLRNGKADEYDD